MAKGRTIAQKLVDSLLKIGWEEVVPSRSGHYREFKKSDGQNHLFVGRSGALRYGPIVSKTRSWTRTKFYLELLERSED